MVLVAFKLAHLLELVTTGQVRQEAGLSSFGLRFGPDSWKNTLNFFFGLSANVKGLFFLIRGEVSNVHVSESLFEYEIIISYNLIDLLIIFLYLILFGLENLEVILANGGRFRAFEFLLIGFRLVKLL